MNNKEILNNLSKEELIKLIEIYSKNWLAHDGVWFQSIERKSGMEEAMFHDREAWRRFTEIEAKRIKEFLKLPEHAGLKGLAKALELRFYGNLNDYELVFKEDRLIFRNVDCRVQTARKRKNMPYHPCKTVGIVEYSGFAKAIDERISCRCLSCFPDITDEAACCSWEFLLNTDKA
ncbi:hypothetical protein LY28_00546 [Ruminiclostridium sufflavum DSM 19573]|uniref:L-2-amino-thiazoline-4-carboxylic acid hydrolase-like protein n=1 Tax=Ruminiclostridium sufflavum DSM 19573 TaxID=1121337 RepID=A0A318XR99_9FIRM|nr:DUF6125 family protein [Ruminiclostridium sufflavum]PYG89946.1 hypothetical protein LY28_00546 [Ruminiclostridium sufflavum DSM 19573]